MISPRYRLILYTGLLALPVSFIVAANPSFGLIGAAIMGAFALLALVDALLALGLLEGITATLPEIVRMTKDREGEMLVRIVSGQPDVSRLRLGRLAFNVKGAKAIRQIRLGLSFPTDFTSPYEDIVTALPGDSPASYVSWPFTGLRRGNYIFENVYLETSSALGFWAIRKAAPARSEVRVYPNALTERKNLAALFLNRGMLGLHAQRQVGKGREFEKLREYVPGDGYEDIHWKATAKRRRPVTKVYQIERSQEVYVVIDTSRLSARPVYMNPSGSASDAAQAPITQLERFITAAMVLGLVAEKQGDRFGLIAFDDQVQRFVRAKNGKVHYNSCRDSLYTLEPNMVNPDFTELCSFIRLRLRRRALLIFLTNLDDPVLAENFARNIELIGGRHLILANMLTNPGVGPLFSEPNVTTTNEIYQRLGGHIQWRRLRELEKLLKRRGVSMALLENETMVPQLVSQYISVKRRQIL